MSLDIAAAIEVFGAIATRPDAPQIVADARTLYAAYTYIKAAGKLDLSGMLTAGTLSPEVAALARTSAVLNTLLADKTQGPHVVALLESVA